MPNAIAPVKMSRKSKIKLPALPWPLPNSGDLEITRWFYEPTSDRNGGNWVYVVHFHTERAERDVLLCLQGRRFREDYITKRRSFPLWIHIDLDLQVNPRLKSPSAKLLEDFQSFGKQVWDRAQYDKKRYKVARARAERCGLCWSNSR
jgi:hypothetical protein